MLKYESNLKWSKVSAVHWPKHVKPCGMIGSAWQSIVLNKRTKCCIENSLKSLSKDNNKKTNSDASSCNDPETRWNYIQIPPQMFFFLSFVLTNVFEFPCKKNTSSSINRSLFYIQTHIRTHTVVLTKDFYLEQLLSKRRKRKHDQRKQGCVIVCSACCQQQRLIFGAL